LDIGFFGFVFAATTFAIARLDMKITIIGLICACLNVFMYGSPLAAVVKSFRHPQINQLSFLIYFYKLILHIFQK
jgi:solute carrier family 50 protein (sugar transporter)